MAAGRLQGNTKNGVGDTNSSTSQKADRSKFYLYNYENRHQAQKVILYLQVTFYVLIPLFVYSDK